MHNAGKSLLFCFLILMVPVFVQAQLKTDLPPEMVEAKAEISADDFRFDPAFQKALTEFRVSGGEDSRGFMTTISETPGLAFLSSAILPGFGQAAHGQWWKTALFAGIEIGAIALMIERRNYARSVERDFWDMADNNWSVVQYAQFLEAYTHLDVDIRDMLTAEGLAIYQNEGQITPRFNNDIDWDMIDIESLREIERNTLYANGNLFSHVLPDYGSQQYYELVSKYFQYGPGWVDWGGNLNIVNGGVADMPQLWRDHNRLEEDFNEAYRFSRNMMKVLLVNHIVSGFDAFFTSRIRNFRATASMQHGGTVHLTYRF